MFKTFIFVCLYFFFITIQRIFQSKSYFWNFVILLFVQECNNSLICRFSATVWIWMKFEHYFSSLYEVVWENFACIFCTKDNWIISFPFAMSQIFSTLGIKSFGKWNQLLSEITTTSWSIKFFKTCQLPCFHYNI